MAGDKLIHFISRGNNTQVMTFPDEPFASYFSGNTVQICPVGALTATPYRFKARPWDLGEQETTCTTCAVGCRTVIQSSRDEVLRYQGVDSDPVNWGWLCDRGRFNFEANKSDRRLGRPMVRTESGLIETSWNTALDVAGRIIREAMDSAGPSSIGLLGGARGSNEDAFAWAQLADAMGVEYRDAQFGDGLPVEVLGLPRATIDDAANAATIILLGPDLKEELPVLFLRLRDAVDKKRSKIIEFTSVESGLSKYAWKSVRYEPGTSNTAVSTALADSEIADQLASGPVVIVVGRQNLAVPAGATIAALQTLLTGLPDGDRPAGVPARQRGRGVVGRPRTGRRRPRWARHPARRRRRQARSARAARRRPDQRLPRCRPRSPGTRRCTSDHLRRHVPVRVDAARRCGTGGSGIRREGGLHDEHRRSRVAARPAGHAVRHDRDPTG